TISAIVSRWQLAAGYWLLAGSWPLATGGVFHCVVLPLLIVTRAILPTPLSASHRLPLLSMSMLRTVPPPPGIGNVSIFLVAGLNRTSTLCVSSPVSTYQIAPSAVMSIAYGFDFGPPGDANSSTLPVLGSRCPRYPRA